MLHALTSALETMVKVADQAFNLWDADEDAKVGKYLKAMAGHLKGYREDLTQAHDALAAARLYVDPGLELARRVLDRCREGSASRHQFADGKGSLAGCSLLLEDIELARSVLSQAGERQRTASETRMNANQREDRDAEQALSDCRRLYALLKPLADLMRDPHPGLSVWQERLGESLRNPDLVEATTEIGERLRG